MKVLARLVYFLLSLRYDISVQGKELLGKDAPYLVMPAHIALVDPIIIRALLRRNMILHPVVTNYFYSSPLLRPIFRLLKAVPVAEIEKDKGDKEDAQAMMQQVSSALAQGENILLYPQGELARQGYQSIIGKKAAFYAVQNAPKNTRLITINIKGLWGSRSSYARNGDGPSLVIFLLKGLFFAIFNLFVFIPKRKVSIEIQEYSKDLRKAESSGLDIFNISLEKIYNAAGEEQIFYRSGLCWYNTVLHHHAPNQIKGSLDTLRKKVDYSTLKYPKGILKTIEEKIRTIKPEYEGEITLSTNLILDCYLDSLDMAEIKSSITQDFSGASNPPLLDLKAVGDLVLMAMGKSPFVEDLKPCERVYPENSNLIYTSLKKELTPKDKILTLFKRNFKKQKKNSFCYDQIFGVQSHQDFLIKAYLIADILRQFPGKNIAIMLPSLSATSLLIVSCYLAEKVPVMLNRTQSEEGFAHCVKSQEISVILTSATFFKKIQKPRLEEYEMTFFEELLKNLKLSKKIKALFSAIRFALPKQLDETAVMLFTSGSEALPKAVPLTHQNILQDLAGAMGILDIRQDEILLAFLPPFHSFWFTVNTILPLISGIRAVYSPDPNDAAQLTNLIQHTKTTLITSTPTFLKGIISIAHKDQLSSLRIAIAGAEKAPEELFQLIKTKAPNSTLLEGYGITECSPVISANPFSPHTKIKNGSVGLPILGADIKILDVETDKELWAKKEGMIYVSGKFVFNGYFDKNIESPFVTINRKKYYKTGDLGFLDRDGYLYISGRLKRFVKIAGEMISLPAIEATLLEKYGSPELQTLAVEAKEYEDGSVKFVLFSINEHNLSEINTYLHEQGISNLVTIKETVLLDEIPLLGTGKTDFMALRAMII